MNTTKREELVALHRKYTDAVWNEGHVDKLIELFAEDAVIHDYGTGSKYEGLDEIGGWVTDLREGFPDLHVEHEDVIVTEDALVARWTLTGTHEGATPLLGPEPTGKSMRLEGATIYELDGEQIVESWWYYDMLGVMGQLGLTQTETPA